MNGNWQHCGGIRRHQGQGLGLPGDKDIESFHRDGFVVVPGHFDARLTERIRGWVDELVALPETPGRHMVYYEDSLAGDGQRIVQRIENFYPYHKGLHDLMVGDALMGAVGALFGEPAVLFKDKVNLKLSGGDGFKPHQDQQAGWNAYASLFITALIALDDCTEENGCLEMAAGHHRRGMIGREWEPLNETDMREMTFVPYPTAPGDVAFFDSYAPHASGPNHTTHSRRVLYVTYNRLSEGDHRERYFADKRKNYPPDCERDGNTVYTFRV